MTFDALMRNLATAAQRITSLVAAAGRSFKNDDIEFLRRTSPEKIQASVN